MSVDARDLTGTGENFERDDSFRDRAARVSDRVKDVFRRTATATPPDEAMEALQGEISGSLAELAGEERRQFEETLVQQLQAFVDVLGAGHLRAFALGAVFASVLWILAFVVVLVLSLVLRHQ